MKKVKTFNQFLNENLNEGLAKGNKLSSAEYQKEKKIKGFNSDDWEWNPDEQLYTRVNESSHKPQFWDLKKPLSGSERVHLETIFTELENDPRFKPTSDAETVDQISDSDLIEAVLALFNQIPSRIRKDFQDMMDYVDNIIG